MESVKMNSLFRFTIVELLVIIAIISVLAALLMPALRGAVASANITSCANNHRAFYLAASIYSEDYNGFVPGTPYNDGCDIAGLFAVNQSVPEGSGTGRAYAGLGRVYGYGYMDDLRMFVDPGAESPSSVWENPFPGKLAYSAKYLYRILNT